MCNFCLEVPKGKQTYVCKYLLQLRLIHRVGFQSALFYYDFIDLQIFLEHGWEVFAVFQDLYIIHDVKS